MSPELEQKLIEKYPSLFRDKDKPPTESLMCFGCACGDGWYDLLDKTFSRIMAIDTKKEVVLVQVKEKWGALRIYFDHPSELYDKVIDILDLAELESIYICENCGSMENVQRNGSWIKYLCKDCAEERYTNEN